MNLDPDDVHGVMLADGQWHVTISGRVVDVQVAPNLTLPCFVADEADGDGYVTNRLVVPAFTRSCSEREGDAALARMLEVEGE